MEVIMDLACRETAENENKAYDDPTLLQPRILDNLLKTEDRTNILPGPTIFRDVQFEVTSQMRKIVAEWMLEVCEEQGCHEQVFSLSMNYVDRFLSTCRIKKNQLQLLGTTCMFLASKLREPSPLAAETLVYYTDHSITKEELWRWELLVLSKLKWDISVITPQDFLKHLLNRLPVESVGISLDMVSNHAKTLIALCAREFKFSLFQPSIIGSASVASALRGVGWEHKSGKSLDQLMQTLHEITHIEKEYVYQCLEQMEDMLRQSSKSHEQNSTSCAEPIRPSEFTPPLGKIQQHETALTPTDVHDIVF